MKNIAAAFLAAFIAVPFCSCAYAQEFECDPIDLAVTTTPVPPQESAKYRDYLEKVSEMPEHADVVFIGDSQINQWPADLAASIFPGQKIWNFGLGSDTTQILKWRIQNTNLKQLSPRSIVLMIGGNNLAFASGCAIARATSEIVEDLHKIWPMAQVIFVGVPPRGLTFKGNNATRLELNETVAAHFSHYRWFEYVNADQGITCGQYGAENVLSFRVALEVSGSICPTYRNDMRHLTREGYAYLSWLVEQARFL